MSDTPVQLEYNETLGDFAARLQDVDRPGGFVAYGARIGPLPRVDVDGVGTLAFPLQDTQADALAQLAEPAPYGRGPDTVYDDSVRCSRQVSADRVQLGGTWGDTLDAIVLAAKGGLGCGDVEVRAEFYKLLLYREGGFFRSHRDSEKAEGMFATLVIVLPSFHRGGDLLVRHLEQEERLSLLPQDVSELRYAAFYTDCVHEVEAVTQGNRLCLVYNLVCVGGADTEPVPPEYGDTTQALASELARWRSAQDGAGKIVWLLDHAYSPAGLSFAGLKGNDAARVSVLKNAAEEAGCCVHLGIVHIEEYGPAELVYQEPYGGSWRGGDDEVNEEYEIIEITDGEQSIDDWRSLDGEDVDFGRLPLLDGDLLPAGALDDEPPDEERVTEATGNAGVGFERAYHRAALVIWERGRTAEVLMAAGTRAAAAGLLREVADADLADPGERARLSAAAAGLGRRWLDVARESSWRDQDRTASGEAAFLNALTRIQDRGLVRAFIEDVLPHVYASGVNDALAEALDLLRPDDADQLAAALLQQCGAAFRADAIDLLGRLDSASDIAAWPRAVEALVAALAVGDATGEDALGDDWHWSWKRCATELTGAHLAALFVLLREATAEKHVAAALKAVARHGEVYAPDRICMDAIRDLRSKLRKGAGSDPGYCGLWEHVLACLLVRSETPVPEPTDWRQSVPSGCHCADCKALIQFAKDPEAREARFPLRADRRQHLHQRIEDTELDMTHETERRGRPYTLVCVKTRRTHARRLKQYARDIQDMRFLRQYPPAQAPASTLARLDAALANATD